MHDIVIIGAGPAGLTAAIYALRANKSVLVLEKESFGGQITYSPKVENYPGYNEISGAELGEKLVEQALNLGAEIELDTVTGIKNPGQYKIVQCEHGQYQAKAVIIASGSRHRQLGLAREDEFTGNGVSYCALCDGAFYKGRAIAVIGGGNTALQDAVLLSDQCSKVTIIQNLGFCTGEERLLEILKSKKNVSFLYNTVVEELEGEEQLSSIMLRDLESGKTSRFKLDGIFVAIGQQPDNKAFESVCKLDEQGFIIADESTVTSTPGIYAAGDCRTKKVRQVVTATGDGAVAAMNACRFAEGSAK
ncbi:MAG: thioredoxin-disulfide reductase [Lentisphaeria bacterium]|nr:thioredoxin-disulfide reductase [Lentisphaeria bacterium]